MNCSVAVLISRTASSDFDMISYTHDLLHKKNTSLILECSTFNLSNFNFVFLPISNNYFTIARMIIRLCDRFVRYFYGV